MNKDLRAVIKIAVLGAGIVMAGCSSDNETTSSSSGSTSSSSSSSSGSTSSSSSSSGSSGNVETAGDANTPPTGKAETIDAWLAKGDYKSWTCETEPHAARSPSPHGTNRICSNTKASSHGDGEYPVGAASVKELYGSDGTTIAGYAIGLHTTAGTTGDSWYWYEKMGSSVVANGLGSTGTAKDVCVGCHAGAGSDAAHPGHDFIYTQVK